MPATAEIEVFYDGHCPICIWEVKLYRRMDRAGHIKWTAIETLTRGDLPVEKSADDLLGKFHVRDLNANEDDWHIGVDAFARIWRALPGLKYFAGLFAVPGIRQLAMAGYKVFLKWQARHRAKRSL